MIRKRHFSNTVFECALTVALVVGAAIPIRAQPMMGPVELDRLVARIALYPDPLVAQILSAATYSEQIPEAARWADHHHYLTGDTLAAAMSGDHLPWDPSVQSLLPFPSVLEMMAGEMNWTSKLGSAVLAQRGDVMDAVQRDRHKAWDFGYLRSNQEILVGNGPFITILPTRSSFYVVPVYDPAVVFVAPRPGFVVGTAIGFGFGVSLGGAYRPWGWGGVHIGWDSHGWFIGDHPWGRTWVNRGGYVHPYGVPRYEAARRVETHELIERSAREREGARLGHERAEEEHHHK